MKLSSKKILSVGISLILPLHSLLLPAKLDSANLTNTKDTLQSSRLSYNGRVKSPTAAGSSHVWIYTSAAAPAYSITTNPLTAGDSLTIGTGAYTVVDVIDSDEFTVSPVLAAGDADDTDPIYLKAKPQHVVTFNTVAAIANGYFRVLLPADATTPNDGNPDDQGFDFGGGSITLTPTDTTGYTFASTVNAATASGGTGCTSPANYHCFEFHYSGAGGVGTAITLTIGNTNGTNTPIAPNTGTSHSEGTADTYTFQVRHYDSSNLLIDQTNGKTALIESVKVTATVDPTITFSIAGRASATTNCNVTADITTTALSVPFGTMSLNTFVNGAHDLNVSTNADYGYAVTASEDDQLGKDGGTTPFIADTTCDGGTCTQSTAANWATATNNGFGYAIENVDAATISGTYNGYNEFARTFSAKQFADIAGSETPQTIMSSTTTANSEDVYVCYRLSVGATQEAGDYENQVIYTATATF